MEDFEDFAWIIWCTLLSSLIFYIIVQVVRYCTKMIKITQETSDEPPAHIPHVDFVISPVYTVSRGAALITSQSMMNDIVPAVISPSVIRVDEKSKNDGLPTYEEAMRIVTSSSAQALSHQQTITNQITQPSSAQTVINPNFVHKNSS